MSFCIDDNCLTGATETEKIRMFNTIRYKIGAPVMGVELTDEQIEECFCEALREYSYLINNWALENRMAEMLGLPSTIDFTLKYVTHSLYFEKSFAAASSEMIGGGVNTVRELKTGHITLTAGTQNYEIPDTHEIEELMWYTPSFINFYGLDPFAYQNIDFTEFGASYAGYSLYGVMPVFDTMLAASAAELRNKVRGSEYSYSIHKGPADKRIIRLYPIPNNSNPAAGGSLNYGERVQTPGTMFYQYFDRISVAGNPQFSGDSQGGWTANTGDQGNGIISGPGDIPLYDLNWGQLNDLAKSWIRKYAQALAKELLGIGIRGKFSGALPIPDAELTLNSADLIQTGRADQERFVDQLRSDLEKLNLKQLLQNRAEMSKSVNEALQAVPLGIYWG